MNELMDGIYIHGAKLSTLEDSFRKIVREEIKALILDINDSEKDTELITRSKAAEILCVSLTTLHDWSVRGIIPSYRIGTRIRYKKKEILDALIRVETP